MNPDFTGLKDQTSGSFDDDPVFKGLIVQTSMYTSCTTSKQTLARAMIV